MTKVLRIGTRESQLAVWQANQVKQLLLERQIVSELVLISSEGDIDLTTPLYEIGVQGIFTKALDIALLKGEIDVAVHSMKDVPTSLARGVQQVAVLPRASSQDILVQGGGPEFSGLQNGNYVIATSSTRRKAQWLHRFPNSTVENLRGNVNTRLRKVLENSWSGAIFAAAGLERIGLKPDNAISLDWMLPAPAQGAIVVAAREGDDETAELCASFNDSDTAICTRLERDFLRALMGGCSTPIGALAVMQHDGLFFRGNILTPDGAQKAEIERMIPLEAAATAGEVAALALLENGGLQILEQLNHGQ